MSLLTIEQLISRGHQVQAVAPITKSNHHLERDIKELGITCHRWPCTPNPPLHRRLLLAACTLKWIRFLRQHPADVIHITTPWPRISLDLLLAVGILKRPTLLLHQLVHPDVHFGSNTKPLYQWCLQRGLRLATVSNSNAAILSKALGVAQNTIEVIENASPSIRTIQSQKHDQAAALKAQYGLPSHAKIVLCIGRISDQKGADIIAPGAYHITKEYPEVYFVWLGDGPQRAALEEQIKTYNLQQRFIITGWQDSAATALKASDLLLFPTRCEGFPLTLVEAMYAELPIVASRAPGVVDLCQDHENCRLFRPEDPCDLMETVRWALNNPQDMKQFAQQAKRDVLQFNIDAMVDKTENSLYKLCQT